jgi:polyhydroxybutyrate depolymerase
MLRSTLICLAAALAALPSTAAGQPGPGAVEHWTVDGVQREALVFAPQGPGTVRQPLVVAFHGHGGTMRATARRMRLQALWPRAIVVYPQGLDTPTPHDPAGTSSGWQATAGELGDRDLRLFDAIVATLRRSYRVDARRIYVTGFSNGAVLSLLLWAQRPRTIAAVGEVAGRLHPAEELTVPRAFLAIAGRADAVAPFVLQRQTIRRAREVDDAQGAGLPCGRWCTFYPSASGPVPVKAFVHPGGHVWPRWAGAELVRFVQAHPQP